MGLAATVTALALAAPARAVAAECDAPQAEWLACEDFEDGGLGWQAWFAQSPFVECLGCPGDVNDPDRIRLTSTAGETFEGSWALHMPAEASAQYQGADLIWRDCAGTKQPGCLLEGHEQLYFRTYVRLAEDHQKVHHFIALAGTQPDRYWDSDGNAGCRPNGYRAAGTTVDFNTSHELFFYTYYPEMSCDSGGYCSGSYAQNICDGCATKDMPCVDGLECCWGNSFSPSSPVLLPRGPWVCLEMMMRLNTPGAADGEMAFWVDDQLAHSVAGMHWRDIAELELNKARLQHYIAVGDATQSNRVWFDNFVVSPSRIGCLGAGPFPDGGVTPTPDGSPVPPRDGGNPSGDGGGAGCGCQTSDHSARDGLLALIGLLLLARRRLCFKGLK